MKLIDIIRNYIKQNKYIYQIFSTFVTCICLNFLCIYLFTNNINQLTEDIIQLTKTNNLLETEITHLNNSNDELKSTVTQLSISKNDLQDQYDQILKEINNYKDQQATINDQNAKLIELQSQYDILLEERDSLQSQIDAKKAEQERIAREKAQQELEKQTSYSNFVYWVSGGEVYHSTPDCPTLKRSSNIHSGSVSASGKNRACKVCN